LFAIRVYYTAARIDKPRATATLCKHELILLANRAAAASPAESLYWTPRRMLYASASSPSSGYTTFERAAVSAASSARIRMSLDWQKPGAASFNRGPFAADAAGWRVM